MKIYLLLISISILLFSCKKELQVEKCSQNCKTFNIKGRFYDGITNEGFGNTSINLRWEYFRYCISCPNSRNVYSGSADENGYFNFNIEIDTSLFNDYILQLKTPVINNYFELFPRDIDKIDLTQNNSINVEYYPKANLELRLHRIQTDTIKNLNIYHIWRTPGTGEFITQYDYLGQTPNIISDTILNIKTVAGIYTKIIIEKLYSNGNRIEISDSLVCNRNVNNIIDMNF